MEYSIAWILLRFIRQVLTPVMLTPSCPLSTGKPFRKHNVIALSILIEVLETSSSTTSPETTAIVDVKRKDRGSRISTTIIITSDLLLWIFLQIREHWETKFDSQDRLKNRMEVSLRLHHPVWPENFPHEITTTLTEVILPTTIILIPMSTTSLTTTIEDVKRKDYESGTTMAITTDLLFLQMGEYFVKDVLSSETTTIVNDLLCLMNLLVKEDDLFLRKVFLYECLHHDLQSTITTTWEIEDLLLESLLTDQLVHEQLLFSQ